MASDPQLHIDSALNQLLGKYTVAAGSDYADFLQRLEEHDRTKVALNTVLEEKLNTLPIEPIGSWKNIIALIWFRRIRNIAIVLLTAIAAFIAIQYQIRNSRQPVTVQIENKTGPVETTPGNLKQSHTNDPTSEISGEIKKHESVNNSIVPAHNTVNKTVTPFAGQNTANSSQKNAIVPQQSVIESQFKLSVCSLQKSTAFAGISQEQVSLLPLIKLSALHHSKTSIFDRIPKTGLVASFQLNSSFQSWHSAVNGNSETTNRDYADLAGNGRKISYTFNYALTLEKNLFKGFGLGFGIGKLTLRQQQTTNYELTEAPVFDLDGHIAGYITITPEKIQTQIDNRVDYMIFPVNLMYGFTLTPGSSLQIKAGSSLTAELKKYTEKFNYSSLLPEQYNSGGQRLSMNNIQYGIAYTRQLRGPVLLSLGYERQVFNKVNALSDHTEKVGASIHNFNISLKYKL